MAVFGGMALSEASKIKPSYGPDWSDSKRQDLLRTIKEYRERVALWDTLPSQEWTPELQWYADQWASAYVPNGSDYMVRSDG
jgi:hypothetical protein